MTVILVVSDHNRFICIFRFEFLAHLSTSAAVLCLSHPKGGLKEFRRCTGTADLHWCVRACRQQEERENERERERVMRRSRGEPPLLDYVKHSHSPEVTALLWKLKVSQRFTAFVSRRLSHPLCGPAPTRYIPHGRLLWTTAATSAAGMSICLHREEGWGEGKRRGLEMGCWFGFKLAVIDGIWHWGGRAPSYTPGF